MKVALAGATGLTGSHVLQLLNDHPHVSEVLALGRRSTGVKHAKLIELPLDAARIKADAFLCCLGTTIKKAGSREKFEAIDVELPLRIASSLKKLGCDRAAVVSAIGASAKSSIFYNRAKGKMENGMRELGFKSLSILRPSIIVGDREEKRAAEKIGLIAMNAAAPVMVGFLRKYRPITAEVIARAMVGLVMEGAAGSRIYESDALEILGSE